MFDWQKGVQNIYFLQNPNLPGCGVLPYIFEFRSAPSQHILPKKTKKEPFSRRRIYCLTNRYHAPNVSSSAFKETLNMVKVNLITSWYPEKKKQCTEKKNLTWTCIYYCQLSVNRMFCFNT
ncbi:Beta-glucuronidase [Platysternon megacephalum]|uniref:Beta-glucuronidase n=1 Tax=Platysternon megacephalum TaxID=55544 RepID=A0A4D9F4Q0_9SAUR|nr:Beta-glucuronidase [Platysternon megacephalum]